jgi:hypothetical protein
VKVHSGHAKPVATGVALSETDPEEVLAWLIRASEGPRAVEFSGNQLAYETAMEKTNQRIQDLCGHRVCWQMEVRSVERTTGITLTTKPLNKLNRNSPTFFYLCVGSYEPLFPRQLGFQGEKILRPLSLPITNDLVNWALSLKSGDGIKVTGFISKVVYLQDPTEQAPTVHDKRWGGWGYGFYVVLKQPSASSP